MVTTFAFVKMASAVGPDATLGTADPPAVEEGAPVAGGPGLVVELQAAATSSARAKAADLIGAITS